MSQLCWRNNRAYDWHLWSRDRCRRCGFVRDLTPTKVLPPRLSWPLPQVRAGYCPPPGSLAVQFAANDPLWRRAK